MTELFQTVIELVTIVLRLVVEVLQLGLIWSPALFWIAWWLFAVNWKKAWHVLAEGGWAPLVLLWFMIAGVWSQVNPTMLVLGPNMALGNFWWQLGAVGLAIGSAFFCGWLQGHYGWTPVEISVEPPAHAPEAAHGHGHH
ncbi:hypothetical protein BH10PLA2_BH10PLA2_08600 [soil metagenome]